MVKTEIIFTYDRKFDNRTQDFIEMDFPSDISEIEFLVKLFRYIGKEKTKHLIKISTCQKVETKDSPDIKFLIGFPHYGKYVFTYSYWGEGCDEDSKQAAIKKIDNKW